MKKMRGSKYMVFLIIVFFLKEDTSILAGMLKKPTPPADITVLAD
ncbi:MAG: hypothetical protein WBF32_13590 [Candidatus Aminicenantaceae bacterium]